MPTVLVTGFEAFDGHEVNASWAAVEVLAETWAGPARLATVQLPVTFDGAPRALGRALDRHAPDLVVGVGEAGNRSVVGVERVALNLIDARIADNDGRAPVDVAVLAGGPTAYLSTLPVKACVAAATAAGAPAEVSHTAGTYVCNAVFYALMHLASGRPGLRAGFVHVPRLPGQGVPGSPSLDGAISARALDAVVVAALTTRVDEVVTAGTES